MLTLARPAVVPRCQWLYVALCVSALDYLHDAWFYWSHRVLHLGPLYRNVHYIHHK